MVDGPFAGMPLLILRTTGATYASDSRRLVEAARERGGRAELLELERLTHSDTADALGDASSPLFQSCLALFADVGLLAPEMSVG